MKNLRQVKIGETAKVVKLHGEGATKRRIMDMGSQKALKSISAKLPLWAIRLKSQYAAMSFPSAKLMPK